MKKEVKDAIEVIKNNCLKVEGDRVIAVLDKGWIFVGNIKKLDNGYFELSNVQNIRKWQSGGFGMVCTDPKSAQVTLDPSNDINFRPESLIFSAPISENWGK